MLEVERWQALKDHFNRALDLPAADRAVFVATSFPEDPTMRQELDRLVRAEAAHGAFLEGMALDGVDSAPELDPLAFRSKRVGQYELLERVAVGGMGEIYRARRADDLYRKTVAVKVAKPGFDSYEFGRRFSLERETLATLDHPFVAKLLDGGATEEGVPTS